MDAGGLLRSISVPIALPPPSSLPARAPLRAASDHCTLKEIRRRALNLNHPLLPHRCRCRCRRHGSGVLHQLLVRLLRDQPRPPRGTAERQIEHAATEDSALFA